MDKTFSPQQHEDKLYEFWEKSGLFTAKADEQKKPFCIILPPPNANADLHFGQAMYLYEDIMIRFRKLQGYETLWLPGADHAGFETQFVFEKNLQKKGKTRFDFKRDELYKMIWDFVQENRDNMENQLKKLGFALDWTKKKFTLDEDIVRVVYETFKKLYDEGLVYREKKLVNYCVKDGTSFSDLEVKDIESEGSLWFIKYPLKISNFQFPISNEYIVVATTRPETMLGDVAIMVNPKDKRYKDLIGKTVILPIADREIPIIADEYVDMKFGTGAVKVTPSHDFNDFEIARKHDLHHPAVIGFNGRIQNTGSAYDGLKIGEAREKIVEELDKKGLLEKVKKHKMVLKTCYKCRRALEPLPLEQWFVKIKPLSSKAKEVVAKDKIRVYPKKFKKVLLNWLENFHDWNISRQIVWGIRIPAYRCLSSNEWFVSVEKPEKCQICDKCNFVQDEDTFDTWFSSAQWPFATLMTQKDNNIFKYFYPTSVMETGYDILPWWVARMIMIGLFATQDIPFKTVFLHGLIKDKKGQKMSKSKGNVVNPMEMIEKYGADAVRAALVFGVKEGNDAVVSEEKIIGMRNFTNKIWNIGRFILLNRDNSHSGKQAERAHPSDPGQAPQDAGQARMTRADARRTLAELQKEFGKEKEEYLKLMNSYQFSKAFNLVYEFLWHRFADYYVEKLKNDLKNGNIEALGVLEKVYLESLVMLHPFLPFVTEAVYQVFNGERKSILNA